MPTVVTGNRVPESQKTHCLKAQEGTELYEDSKEKKPEAGKECC